MRLESVPPDRNEPVLRSPTRSTAIESASCRRLIVRSSATCSLAWIKLLTLLFARLDLVDAGNHFLRVRHPAGVRQRTLRREIPAHADQDKDQPAHQQGPGSATFGSFGQHRVPPARLSGRGRCKPRAYAPLRLPSQLADGTSPPAVASWRYAGKQSPKRAPVGHFSRQLPAHLSCRQRRYPRPWLGGRLGYRADRHRPRRELGSRCAVVDLSRPS